MHSGQGHQNGRDHFSFRISDEQAVGTRGSRTWCHRRTRRHRPPRGGQQVSDCRRASALGRVGDAGKAIMSASTAAKPWICRARARADPYSPLARRRTQFPASAVPDAAPPVGAVSDGANRDRGARVVQDEFVFPETAAALFTFAETARCLRVAERTLRLLVARHGPPVIKAGRRVLFDEVAINHLIESLRCPSKSSPVPTARSSGSQAPSAANAFERALAQTAANSLKKCVRPAKPMPTARNCTA